MATIPRRRDKKPAGADLTPMIDVVFLLLVFFMVATNFVEETQQFEVELPKAEEAETITEAETMSILVHAFEAAVAADKRVVFRIAEKPVSRAELFTRIQAHHEKAKPKVVVIKADKDARYQDIVSVISCLHGCGIEHFNLAVMGSG